MGLTGHAITREHTYGGSALCGWFRRYAQRNRSGEPLRLSPSDRGHPVLRRRVHPLHVRLRGRSYSGQALVDKYALDAAPTALFTKANIPVYFVSTPISRGQAAQGDVGNTPLGVMFSKLPSRYPHNPLVRFINAAAAVELNGHYTDTLPCERGEVCTGHWPDGTPTGRRASGRRHPFLPGQGGHGQRCDQLPGGDARSAALRPGHRRPDRTGLSQLADA